ncbi:hypothetical protein ECG_05585 [Echinococcus granulosus]|uniref:Uncharacterized protein n=1 Tax=Echinococcus granulosus TaxID=6210 RepID=A0A068WLE6_ECHGR|nr:hypothetical protein ECG_05585 [Echinococcus granulosus]CDS18494.1 hypothetical protein EgrG_000628100 [Echinococcus granulosus]
MSESTARRSFSLRKTATGVDFPIPVNFEETLKGVKPPIIPPLFRSVCEEILARIASRQLSILPAPLSTLFVNADAIAGNLLWTARIDEVIKLLHFEKKGLSEKQRILKRKADLEPHQTSVITRAMFRYIELCSEGIDLTVNFPAYGYLVLGPPPQSEGKPDIKSYIRSLDSFIRAALEKNPIKRDIFCYFMHFMSQIYQLMGDSYRSQPALCGMTRYLLANRFGEEMISLYCTECGLRIEESRKGCQVCSDIATHIKPPYRTQVIDMMLEYIPLSYWREKLNDPRRGLVEQRETSTKIEELNFITQARTVSSVGDFPHFKATSDKGRMISKKGQKKSLVGSSGNNGVSLRKSRTSTAVNIEELKRSMKIKDSEESAEKSGDNQGPTSKRKPEDLLRIGIGSDGTDGDGIGGATFGSGRRNGGNGGISGPKSIGGRRSGGVGEAGGSGIISSALRKDSTSSISLTRRQTPSSVMRSTLFTTPPTLSHESTGSTTTERMDKLNISTPRRQMKKKQRRARSRTRKPGGRSPSRKNRQRTRSPGTKKKGRARSPKNRRGAGKSRGRKRARKTPRSRGRRRGRSRRR